MILAASSIKKSFITHEVLRDVTFHIEAREKMALVGVNGAGKTTLFQILLGNMQPDDGNLFLQKGVRIGYLPQNSDYRSEKRIEEELLTVFNDLRHMEERMRELEILISEKQTPEYMEEYATLQHRFTDADGYQYRSRVRGVLKGLGFADSEYELPISSLSGGQRSRIALGKLLLENPDVLLLDEPTNHLDIQSISWLESYLTGYTGAAIIISHDRYFLDKLCTKTMEIERGVATVYKGNYTYYVHEKEVRAKTAMREYAAQQAEIKRQEEIIARLRSYGMEKFMRRAISREKALERMDILDRPSALDASMKFTFTPSMISGDDVLTAEHVAKSFDGKDLFRNMNFTIHRGEKIALLGANGTGKTTLFKMIMGKDTPNYGYLHLGVKVFPGYYDQQQENLDPDKSVLDEIYDNFPQMTLSQIRNVLGAFLFRGEDVFKLIGQLSGGEKARVSLCKIMLSKSNFLLLDEPTNHLDIVSREVLENNLKSYEGTLFFISHDRYFINSVADKIFELTPDGVRVYLGNYDFYLEHMNDEVTAATEIIQTPTQNKESFQQQKMQQRELTKKKTRYTRLEKMITDGEDRLAEIEEQMLDPKFYSSASAFAKLENEKAELSQNIEEWMDEWSLLSEELEL